MLPLHGAAGRGGIRGGSARAAHEALPPLRPPHRSGRDGGKVGEQVMGPVLLAIRCQSVRGKFDGFFPLRDALKGKGFS